MELNEKTKKEIKKARADINSGKLYTHDQIKKILGINTRCMEFKTF